MASKPKKSRGSSSKGVKGKAKENETDIEVEASSNAGDPSSAACERLFSTAGLIFVPKRTSLSDNNFDKLVFLKQNGSCSRNWQLSPSKT
jgi:hypothetical protein